MIDTNTEEYKKLVEKARRGLIAYLNQDADEYLSEDAHKKLFRVINRVFREKMKTDAEIYINVKEFCSERRYQNEKNSFYFIVMTKITPSVRAALS